MVIHARNFVTPDRALGGAVIEKSLRFTSADNTYLTRTNSTSGNRKTWTYSFWFKRTSTGNISCLINGNTSALPWTFFYIENEKFWFWDIASSGVGGDNYWYNLMRDFNAWYHVVLRVDTTQATAANRVRIYVNGVQAPIEKDNLSTIPQNRDTQINGTTVTEIFNNQARNRSLKGYLADVYMIDGQSLDPTYFAYTESQTGIWRPKKYTGTYGTNGFHLEFKDNSGTTATTLGKDTSGNGNHWTPGNFSVSAGAGNDSVEDTPTNNFCTMNSIDRDSSVTASDGNLKVSNNNQVWAGLKGTFAVSSGKWYYEIKGSDNNLFCGWASDDLDTFLASPQDNNTVMSDGVLIIVGTSGQYQLDTGGSGTRINYGSALSANDVLGCAIDLDNNTAQYYINGTGQGSINISSSKLATKQVHPYFISLYTAQNYTFNFGQQPFTYTPPTGYKTLSSKNLPPNVPSIIRPQKHFETVTYSGTGSTNKIESLEFAPDLVWVKRRDATNYHILSDTIRGAGNYLVSNTNDAESSGGSQLINGFLKNGFQVGTENAVNNSSGTYVAWCWKAGGAAVTNNDGSIASQVSVNEEAGFSIVTYTGDGSSGKTVGHGLDATPVISIRKKKDASSDWFVHHTLVDGSMDFLKLNSNTSNSNSSLSAFTSTTLPVDDNTNQYVSYCWHEVPGYSKFGSYIGNGSSEGVFVHLGFRADFIMIKSSSLETNWNIVTADIDGYNVVTKYLDANTSSAEGTYTFLDVLSNGFKARNVGNSFNQNGASYIYMAFAKQPGTTPFGTFPNAR